MNLDGVTLCVFLDCAKRNREFKGSEGCYKFASDSEDKELNRLKSAGLIMYKNFNGSLRFVRFTDAGKQLASTHSVFIE